MLTVLETENLRLRKFTTADGDFVVELVNTPGWLEFIGNKGVRTREEAQLYLITGPMTSYEKFGFGLYMVELKADKTPIGMCGLIKRESLEDVDIGFALLPQYHRKGFAYEAALSTLNYAQNSLGIKRIVSITNSNNVRSISLIQKLGMVFEKKIKLPPEKKEILLFANGVRNDTGPTLAV